jgi:hypothetical protein
MFVCLKLLQRMMFAAGVTAVQMPGALFYS